MRLLFLTEWNPSGHRQPGSRCDWLFRGSSGSVSSPDHWLPAGSECRYVFDDTSGGYLEFIVNVYGLRYVTSLHPSQSWQLSQRWSRGGVFVMSCPPILSTFHGSGPMLGGLSEGVRCPSMSSVMFSSKDVLGHFLMLSMERPLSSFPRHQSENECLKITPILSASMSRESHFSFDNLCAKFASSRDWHCSFSHPPSGDCDDEISIYNGSSLVATLCSGDVVARQTHIFYVDGHRSSLLYRTATGQLESEPDRGFWLSFRHVDGRAYVHHHYSYTASLLNSLGSMFLTSCFHIVRLCVPSCLTNAISTN